MYKLELLFKKVEGVFNDMIFYIVKLFKGLFVMFIGIGNEKVLIVGI